MKNLKTILITISLLLVALPAFSASREEADALYARRDSTPEGMNLAWQAANMYAELASNTSSAADKAQLLIRQSMAIYFVGDMSVNSDEKIKFYSLGKEVALNAASILEKVPGEAKDPANTELLAHAYYWYGVNLGKWGEASGILSSLGQWPTLRKYMEYIINMGQEDIEYYGASRTLGRAYFKLPYPLGSTSKSLSYLEEAFNNTLDSKKEISVYGLNVVYYAETLLAVGGEENKRKARNILEKLVEKGNNPSWFMTYNPDRIPETKKEIELAKNILSNM